MYDTSEFRRLASRRRPRLDELLLAMAAQFRPVDEQRALERLDDLSRRLFGLAALHADGQAGCVCHASRHEIGLRPADCADPEHLMLDAVLRRRRGHPLLLTVVAVELARRAGVCAGVCSSRHRWFAEFGLTPQIALVELGRTDSVPATSPVLRRCAHEVAYEILRNLHHAYEARACGREAGHAAELMRVLRTNHRTSRGWGCRS